MKEQEKRRKYFVEFGVAIAFYLLVLGGAVLLAPQMPDSSWRLPLQLSPIVPIALLIWAIVRGFRRTDEFVRLRSLENIAVAAAVTAGWTVSYGFMETVGFPRLSMFVIWPVMGLAWAGIAGIRRVAG